MGEDDIRKFPEYFLVKMSIKNGHEGNTKIQVGNKRRFRLGMIPVKGIPVKRARLRKPTNGCHKEKIKFDTMTSNVLFVKKVEGEFLSIETLTSIYLLFPA